MSPMQQQMGQFRPGNPAFEGFLAQLLGGMTPKMGAGIGLPQQQGMGGFGQMARMSPNYGTSPLKRMKGTTNYKQFLQQHSMYGKKVNIPIDNSRLLKF